jgi:DNA (cytosine-5)-methyltransferase 1
MTKTAGPKIPLLSLFCGAGGLDSGFVDAGFRPVRAYDHSSAAVSTYNRNIPGKVARIADLSDPTEQALSFLLDGLQQAPRGVIGGPPCQGFSYGNTRAKLDDPRNLLVHSYAEIIEGACRRFPIEFFVLENVAGLKSSRHADRLARLMDRLDEIGFNVVQGRLDAKEFGAPQKRIRLFLVGISRRFQPGKEFVFPSPTTRKERVVAAAIAELPEPTFFRRGMKPEEIEFHPNHWTSPPNSTRFTTGEFGGAGQSFRQLEWDKPSWTVAYGNREIHVHPDGRRRLSILEAMLLQTFARRWVFKGNFSEQVQQVSNAVPPCVARAVARAIRAQLFNAASGSTGDK